MFARYADRHVDLSLLPRHNPPSLHEHTIFVRFTQAFTGQPFAQGGSDVFFAPPAFVEAVPDVVCGVGEAPAGGHVVGEEALASVLEPAQGDAVVPVDEFQLQLVEGDLGHQGDLQAWVLAHGVQEALELGGDELRGQDDFPAQEDTEGQAGAAVY